MSVGWRERGSWETIYYQEITVDVDSFEFFDFVASDNVKPYAKDKNHIYA